MNSTNSHRANEDLLDRYVKAAREQFDATEIEYAAQKLRQRLPRARANRRASFVRLSLAAAASLLLAAITVVPLFLPGDNGNAFAQAQQWFASFRTLQVETTVEMGRDTVTNTVLLDESGDVRIESAGVVTIVKPESRMIYILFPDGHAIAQNIPNIPPDNGTRNLTEWLDDIRNFQGQAELIAEPRFIEGTSAIGYSLTIGASTLLLWVDPFDGKPLLVEVETPSGVTMRSALRFDVPLPADAFDVPEGIHPLELHE